MKKIPELNYFIAGFVVLTIILIIAGTVSSKRPVKEDPSGPTIRQFRTEKDDIIEMSPLLLEPRHEIEGQVESYQSRIKDIIHNDRPLPLLPAAAAPIDPGLLQENGVLKNLYKESNTYYIDGNEEQKPKVIKGIRN